ncbi:MAG: transglutaminase-like domain-containing protein [Candidatus Woesearchaeota archaeon]
MNKALALLLTLVVLPCVIASQEAMDLFASEAVTIDLSVSSQITLMPKADKLDVEYLEADLYFFPKEDEAQQVSSITTNPEADRFQDYIRYKWEQPQRTRLSYKAQAIVKVRNFFPRVLHKIPFPLGSIPKEVQEYLRPSKHIDSDNPEIVNLANRLAMGRDDLYEVVSEIAIWTKNNIKYNLSTLTTDVSQKASWVLQNRQGVCDELTSLFIALCRAVGVPARFVTGVSYTSSPLFVRQWGNHGWAEVYFPGAGWIPFDPTFGEFGWVDPGHIKMMTGTDPEMHGVRFEWQGRASLEFTEQEVNARIVNIAKRIPPLVSLDIKPVYREVGFGSYNLVQATVENLQHYYITTEVRLARVNELHVIEPMERQVMLKPREKKTLFWRVQVDPGLFSNFVYTIPLGIYTVMNDTAFANFTATKQGMQHSKTDVTKIMNALSEEEAQVVSHNLEIVCSPDKEKIYPDENAAINCTLRNTGTTPLIGVSACLEEKKCIGLDIGIGQTRNANFVQGFTTPGTTTVFVKARSPELTKSMPIAFQMLDLPKINISGVSHPANISYGQKFTLLFVLVPASYNKPRNVLLNIITPAGKRFFEIPELVSDRVFEIGIDSDELSLGTTSIMIEAEYKDDRGKTYKTKTSANITLTDVPFFTRIWLWFRGLFY